ncbi:MAG: hypothetical protein KC731_39640 [Myxococcales bacterium]|nr:hypothetical protein [Myxococcales bacterium]
MSSSFARFGVLAGAVLFVSASCADIAGLNRFMRDEGSEMGGGDGDGGRGQPSPCDETGCEPNEECLPPVPAGWDGPVVLHTKCSESAYRVRIDEGVVDLNAPPASCGCTCAPASGEICAKGAVALHKTNDCSDGATPTVFTPACVVALSPPPTMVVAFVGSDTPPTGGSCAPMPTVDVPEPTGSTTQLCGIPTQEHSRFATTGCAPVSASDGHCIFAAGDLPCPGGLGYGLKSLVHAGALTDDRDCTTCSCGTPQGGLCQSETTVYSVSNCTSPKKAITHDGSCTAMGSAGFASLATVAGLHTPGTCEATGGEAVGEATTERLHTVCCTP